jgi:hypothetical protein
VLGQHRRSEVLEASYLRPSVAGSEVQVHPVLARLDLPDPPEREVLDTETRGSQGDELVPVLADLATCGLSPELGEPTGLGAVEGHVSHEEAMRPTLEIGRAHV